MYIDSKGIVLRQVKTVNGRRMICIFTEKYGKINAGTNISEKGRGKSALALRPFTLGKYEINKNKGYYNLNGAEAVKSYYKIGEDIDKYWAASYVLEFTDKLLIEEEPMPNLFKLLAEYMDVVSERKKDYETMNIAYQVKSLQIIGLMPEINRCVSCGKEVKGGIFKIKEGGIICSECSPKSDIVSNAQLLFNMEFAIIEVLNYFVKNSLESLKQISLDEDIQKKVQRILRDYCKYHLDIGQLKSESFSIDV